MRRAMCGIAGLIAAQGSAAAIARSMADAIVHRGPDDDGVWDDPATNVAFAHRRLSIVDLSPSGHQPMTSADGQFVLTYNGEIYNHAELRAALEREEAGPVGGWRG